MANKSVFGKGCLEAAIKGFTRRHLYGNNQTQTVRLSGVEIVSQFTDFS